MDLENLPLTTRDDAEVLRDKQLQTWEVTRRGFANWLLERGKNPKSLEGYSEHTAKDTLYRTDHFARFVWNHNEFKTSFTHSEANEYMEGILLDDDRSASHASGTQKAIKRLFKYQRPSMKILRNGSRSTKYRVRTASGTSRTCSPRRKSRRSTVRA